MQHVTKEIVLSTGEVLQVVQITEDVVDRLMEVLAEKVELEKEEKALKQSLIDSGLATAEGTLSKASIMRMPGRKTVDVKALTTFLKTPSSVIEQFTKVGNPFYTVKIMGK